jgi:ferredoxin
MLCEWQVSTHWPPVDSPFFEQTMLQRYERASTWSERHAAHVAGLGTFGLSDGLITRVGKAMRCGSVIARIQIPPSPRPYDDHHAYCLFFTKGTCGRCADRCPAGSVTREGRSKPKCRDYVLSKTADYVKSRFGVEIYGSCGLCQTGVSCESNDTVEGLSKPKANHPLPGQRLFLAMSLPETAPRKDVPVILCTGYSETMSPEKAKDTGIRKL